MFATTSRSAVATLRTALPAALTAQRSAHTSIRSMASTSSSSAYQTSLQFSPRAASRPRAALSASTASICARAFSSSRPAKDDTSAASAGTGEGQMSSGEQEIYELLTKRFQPSHLMVADVSGGCGSFYSIELASTDFEGLRTVQQHRLVNECLKDIIGNIHGLRLTTKA